MKKGLAILEVGVGEKAERGIFRFLRDDYQVFVCDALVVKPFAVGRYRIVPSVDFARQICFLVKRVGSGDDIGYIGDGGLGNGDLGIRNGDFGLRIDTEGYGLGYVALGYGYVDGVELSHRSVAVSELFQAMLLLPHCEFEVKESGVGDES